MSTFSRIQMTDVDSRPDICFPSPPLADWTDITFPTVCFDINRVCLKPAWPIMQQVATVYTPWPISFFWMLWNIYFHILIMHTINWPANASIHFVQSMCCLEQNIPSGIRDEMPCCLLGVFASPAAVELAAFFCSASLIASSLVSGQDSAKGSIWRGEGSEETRKKAAAETVHEAH